MVVEGSTQRVARRSRALVFNIMRVVEEVLDLPDGFGGISLQNYELHCCVSYQVLPSTVTIKEDSEVGVFCATANLGVASEEGPWNKLNAIVDKVRGNVCGHSNFTDTKVFLEPNGIWREGDGNYLAEVLEKCGTCKGAALAEPPRQLPLSSMCRELNDVVSIAQMFLGESCVAHIMDTKTGYSIGAVVPSTSMEKAIEVFGEA